MGVQFALGWWSFLFGVVPRAGGPAVFKGVSLLPGLLGTFGLLLYGSPSTLPTDRWRCLA